MGGGKDRKGGETGIKGELFNGREGNQLIVWEGRGGVWRGITYWKGSVVEEAGAG